MSTTSASHNATEEKQAPTLAEVVRKLDTENLIEFLRGEEDLQLDEDDFKILRDEKIAGHNFLKLSKQDFRDCGFKVGPATTLVEFAKEVKEKKLRAFSSYRSLREVLLKYGFDIDGVEAIPLFELPRYEIQDNDQHFAHCMADILFRMKHYGSLVLDSLESMRNEYVSTLLHTALHIAGDLTSKEFSMRPEYEIVGDESSGRVDYGIKESENLICVTEDKVQSSILEGFAQNIKQLESSYETNKKKRKREDDDFDYLYGIVT
ncbi:16991_t:CDS:2, partial [Acaulospora colombiana]